MIDLYAARRYLGLDTLKETGLRMPVQVYFKDPAVAEAHEAAGIDHEFTTPWEPGLCDGPTSSRFAVVDYDSTSNTLTPPAVGTGKELLPWSEGRASRRADQGTFSIPRAQRLGHRSKHA